MRNKEKFCLLSMAATVLGVALGNGVVLTMGLVCLLSYVVTLIFE